MAAPTLALYAHSTQCTLILLLKANSKTTENEPFRWKIYGSFNCNIMHTGINSCCVNRPNRQIYDLCPRSFSLSVLFSPFYFDQALHSATQKAASTREKKTTHMHLHTNRALHRAQMVCCLFFWCKNHLFSNREVNNNRTKKKMQQRTKDIINYLNMIVGIEQTNMHNSSMALAKSQSQSNCVFLLSLPLNYSVENRKNEQNAELRERMREIVYGFFSVFGRKMIALSWCVSVRCRCVSNFILFDYL